MIDRLIAAIRNIAVSDSPIGIDKAKEEFANCFYPIIDHRIEAVLEEKKSTPSDRIAVADSINSSIKSTASTIKIMSALASAPKPPERNDDVYLWLENYIDWYNINREDALKIK